MTSPAVVFSFLIFILIVLVYHDRSHSARCVYLYTHLYMIVPIESPALCRGLSIRKINKPYRNSRKPFAKHRASKVRSSRVVDGARHFAKVFGNIEEEYTLYEKKNQNPKSNMNNDFELVDRVVLLVGFIIRIGYGRLRAIAQG